MNMIFYYSENCSGRFFIIINVYPQLFYFFINTLTNKGYTKFVFIFLFKN